MANLAESQFEERKNEFESEQLRAVESLYGVEPENLLKRATKIGIITTETRRRIESVLPNHLELFNGAFQGPNIHFINEEARQQSFVRAFETVYGRFILEDDNELSGAGSPLLKTLKDVLKFDLDEHGFKGRPELQSAARRFAMLKAAGKKSLILIKIKKDLADARKKLVKAQSAGDQSQVDNLNAHISELEEKEKDLVGWILKQAFGGGKSGTEIKALERTHREAISDEKKLRVTYDYFSSADNLSAINESASSLAALMAEVDVQKVSTTTAGIGSSDGETAMSKIAKAPFNTRIHKLKGLIASYSEERSNLRYPSGDALRKELDAKERSYRAAPGSSALPDDFRTKEEEKIKEAVSSKREALTAQIDEANEALDRLTKIKEKCKTLKDQLTVLVKNLKAASDLNVPLPKFKDDNNLKVVEGKLKAIELDSKNFEPKDFKEVFDMLGNFLTSGDSLTSFMQNFDQELAKKEENVKTAKKALDKAKSANALNENLTDSQAAKRLIAAIVAEQNPDMSLTDQQKLATMILANDVATLQTKALYGDLAKRASAELLDTVRQAGFKEKLIGFRYKVDEKVQQPFKDLKPENFKDWAGIERLFNIGRLNHQTGFFVLAALEIFEGDQRSIQYVQTERKLKKLLAEQLDTEDRLDESGVVNIVNEAFKDQLEQARSLVQAYFNYYDSNSAGLQENKVRELNIRYEKLKEESRLGKIAETVYKKRLEALIKEARERDLMDQVDFSQSTVLADFWNSDDSEWLRGGGSAVGKYAKEKALAVGKGGLRLTGRALSGTIGVGASLAGQTLMTPFRLVKYPVLAATKPLVWFVNLFRTNRFAPINISQTVVTDVGRVTGYFKQLGTETLAGAKTAVTTIPKEELGKEHFKAVGYKERTKVDIAALEEQAKELQEKAEATPVEVAGSPFIDLKKYRKKIETLDRILAAKPAGGAKAEAA